MPQRAAKPAVIEKSEWDAIAKESLAIRETPTEDIDVDIALVVSQFCHYYAGEFRNGDIPWRLFWLLYSCIPNIAALDRINQFHSAIMSGGMIHSTEEGRRQMQRQYEQDVELAQGKE